MIRSLLQQIDGITTYPVVSLILFFTFFIMMLIIVLRLDKKHLNSLKNLPLDTAADLNNMGDNNND